MTPWLGGKSVLIVEDEFLIGLMLVQEIHAPAVPRSAP